jgi:hypothetical protein
MRKYYIFSIAIVGCLVFINSADTDEKFIISLTRKIITYNQRYAIEKVFAHTDKQLYQPGENIWFKAYVSSTLYKDFSSISKDLYIKVFDVFGNEIVWKRYPVENNTASGFLSVPQSAETGKYTLVAYTGWMKNMEASDVFHNDIIISKDPDRQLYIDVKFAGDYLKPEQEIQADLSILTKEHLPAVYARYSYSVNYSGDAIIKGRGETDNEGKGTINFKLPANTANKLVTLNIEAKYSGERGSFTIFIPDVNNNVDLKFYPEGGSIVAGIISRIAFKATDSYGFPFEFEGNVYNDNNEIVSTIKSTGNGMGVFRFIPESGKYRVKINRPEGIEKEFFLPEVQKEGLVISYEGIKDNSIIISARSGSPGEITETYWLGRMNNTIYWGTIIKLKGAGKVEIPLINFPAGIVRINVFNKDKLPLAERLIYVEKPAEPPVKVSLNKEKFGPREKVTVRLTAGNNNKDTAKTDVSISVANKEFIYNPERLCSSLNSQPVNCQLTEESAGFISKFRERISDADIDLLMMVSKLKGISYSDLLKDDIIQENPYYQRNGLSGIIMDKKGNPVKNATLKFIHAPNKQIYEAVTDEKGVFNVMFGQDIIDFKFLTLSVSEKIAGQADEVLIDNTFSNKILEYFAVNKENWDIQKTIDMIAWKNPDIIYTGKYKKIKNDRISIEPKKQYNRIQYSGYADVLDIIREMKQFTLINNQIVFQGGINSLNFQQGALIIIDGVKVGTDIGVLETISTSDIENINISTNVVDIHAYTGLNAQGIIEITTLTGEKGLNSDRVEKDDLINIPEYDAKFHSPDYEIETDVREDLRTTIYWNNNLEIIPGRETVINFYTSDIKGEYVGRVEGIRDDGKPVTAEFEYIVE